MAALAALTTETIAWLNGKRHGAPLGPDRSQSQEVELGTRLNELSKVRFVAVAIENAATTGTASFGAAYANAKCVGSLKSDTGGLAVFSLVGDCDSVGDAAVVLSTAPGIGDSCVVNVWADAR